MDFAAHVKVTTVIHRLGEGVQVSAEGESVGHRIDLYLEVPETDLQPGDYIEITGHPIHSRP